MMYPLVRELAGDGIPVTVTFRVLKISRQPYYRWLACPVTAAEPLSLSGQPRSTVQLTLPATSESDCASRQGARWPRCRRHPVLR
jgi:hypothetical protein